MLNFNPDLSHTNDYQALFINDTPLLDVRAPIEFAQGAFPHSSNHLLINDDERHQVGLVYKQQGQDAAIDLGLQLVSGENKQQRITAWQQFATQHPQGALYCFRGGMRSKIAQQWLYENTGIHYPRVTGGYKQLRRYLIEQLERNAQQMRPVILAGRTGVGKTRLIQTMQPHLDLEKLAWHRGSAFGRHSTPQPTQINFENTLSIALLKIVVGHNPYFISEDESRNIGARHIPNSFFTPFSQAPIIVLEADIEERIAITLQEYVHDALQEYCATLPYNDGFNQWENYLTDSLKRIHKRLGGKNYAEIQTALHKALQTHRTHGDTAAHRVWIELLLTNYYDSMYTYQLAQKKRRIVFQGERESVVDYLRNHYRINKAA